MDQAVASDLQEYECLKTELKATLDETADNFIVIGYILKQVRDRCLYLHENYSDIYGFGLGAYGLSRATVSRFMNINTKFSVGGNSREMKPEFKGYGRSKIQEMLNIDESDMQLVTAATTVEQVKELKKAEEQQRRLEKEEQENNLPLVWMAAGQEEGSGTPGPEPADPFETVLAAFWKENTDLYRKVAAGLITPGIAAEEISPSGSRTFRDGVNIVFFYDVDKGLKLRSYAKGRAEITPYTYQELIDRTMLLDIPEGREGADGRPEGNETETGMPEEPVATPQHESDGQPAYIPIPGQTSVEGLQDVMPDMPAEPDTPSSGPDAEAGIGGDVPAMENVADGGYRELGKAVAGQQGPRDIPYTDDEIRRVIEYYDIEYMRMAGLHMEGLKKLCCKVARECIRKCYKHIADQVDSSMF